MTEMSPVAEETRLTVATALSDKMILPEVSPHRARRFAKPTLVAGKLDPEYSDAPI
jgi:hypothetical protein